MASTVVQTCQACGSSDLYSVLFLGYLPPVNQMRAIGARPHEEAAYPAELLRCRQCTLVQLGLEVDPRVLFPEDYPYTSSTTKVLRENFADLYARVTDRMQLGSDDLVVDIGSNDGNLLSNFVGKHRVLGITPEKIGELAVARGIPTIFGYFDAMMVPIIQATHGRAKLLTMTNVFAHIPNVNEVIKNVLAALKPDGVFVSESHYLGSLLATTQYDTIYHEHLRYYSVTSLYHLFKQHELEIFDVEPIPSHGGSIRVYAARCGQQRVQASVATYLAAENTLLSDAMLASFARRTARSKLALYTLLARLTRDGARVAGVGAPSRAATLVNYVGLDESLLTAIAEAPGSYKVGKYMPGTMIPILDETAVLATRPEYLLLLSWHIADELIPKLRAKGYEGSFIVPLPEPTVRS